MTEENEKQIWEGAIQWGISLSDEQVRAFMVYLEELKRWNARMNLTAVREDHAIIARHFLDSLAGLAALPDLPSKQLRVLDVGTGAGFPGIPLRICLPKLRLTLLEPKKKKAAFLHNLCGRLGLQQVAILTRSIQDLARDPRNRSGQDAITLRGIAAGGPLRYAVKLLAPAGRVLVWKSQARADDWGPEGLPASWRVARRLVYRIRSEEKDRVLIVLTPD